MPESRTEDVPSVSLVRPLRSFAQHPPAMIAPGASIRDAYERMAREGLDGLVVGESGSARPVGFLALRAMLRALAKSEVQLDDPVLKVTQDVAAVSVSKNGTMQDALATMTRSGEHLVCLVDDVDRVVGVLGLADLFRGERLLEEIVAPIIGAHSIAELATSAVDTRRFLHGLVSGGAGVEQIMRWNTFLTDLVSVRVIDMMISRFDLPKVPWCWMVFGSEGREEQTFVTDQDNGLMFAVPEGESADALRERFLPYAQAVNQALDDCGVPYCRGQIMAGNPAWCLSEREWLSKFRDWIVCGDPKALLNASIFFDFRALYGHRAMVEDLRRWLLEESASSALFLRLMAQNALQCQPPVGLLRSFVLDRDKAHPDTIDLKMAGSRPFVDAARLFALALGIGVTGTADRLRAVARHPSFAKEDLPAAIEAFFVIQLLRLRSQMRANVPDEASNRIKPYSLNGMERSALKQAFREAQRLQARLKADHRL